MRVHNAGNWCCDPPWDKAHKGSAPRPADGLACRGYGSRSSNHGSTLVQFKQSFKLIVLATALAAGTAAMAQDNTAPREQRMEEALQNYRNTHSTQPAQVTPADPRNPQPGPAARAEESVKRGARNAGHAVKDGAQRTGAAIKHGGERAGDAVGRGVEKTGAAIRRGGEKIQDKTGG